jgi:two-component system, NarL family, nitrate/nitrite response regulator NarL
MSVRVVVADDHPVFLDGLARIVSRAAELTLVATARDGRVALDRIRAERPEVALIDLELPDVDGFRVIETVRREALPTRVLVISAFVDSAKVYRAMEAGAAGYVPKVAGDAAITDAILGVARGETQLVGELLDGLATEIRLRREHAPGPSLTPRELDVLRLAADGHPNAEIARQLLVSTATVKSHLQNVFEKLEAPDRAAAVARAIRRGLVN